MTETGKPCHANAGCYPESMPEKIRVAVLFGGQSVEHDVSLLSARSVIGALDPDKYEAVPIAITREGHWLPPGAATALLGGGGDRSHDREGVVAPVGGAGRAEPGHEEVLAPADVPNLILAPGAAADFGHFDVVFPLVHGTQGEDGTIQGLLELASLPYVGAGVLASAAGMDKFTMKRLFRDAGLPIPRFLAVTRRHGLPAIERLVAETIGYPCFVKPANGGSSVGITKVHTEEELQRALELALQLDRRALVEEAIDARELECSVLGNDDPQASAIGEIVPGREFYDYQAKYFDQRTQLCIPAPVPEEVACRVRSLAIEAFRAIDCAGMARVDFFLRRADGTLFVNEINTIPGFTSVSMYPKLWEASGVSYRELVDRLIQLALERHTENEATRRRYTSRGTGP